MSEVTRMIEQIETGDMAASEQLLPLVYKELHTLARRRLAKNPHQSLQTTELVHEAYLRLVGSDQKWQGRAHFFAAAAEAMRRTGSTQRPGCPDSGRRLWSAQSLPLNQFRHTALHRSESASFPHKFRGFAPAPPRNA